MTRLAQLYAELAECSARAAALQAAIAEEHARAPEGRVVRIAEPRDPSTPTELDRMRASTELKRLGFRRAR